jgi:hypothetical protein
MEVNKIGDDRHTRPKIVRITTHEEDVTFLQEDDHITLLNSALIGVRVVKIWVQISSSSK